MKTYTKQELDTILELHAKWLQNEPLGMRADLCSANLYGADLRSAYLSGANLSGANLYGADLRSANLSGADLRSANLSGANLYGADLSGANLSGANLYGADLYGAYLYGANLYGADLYGAYLYGADLRSANLEDKQIMSLGIQRTLIVPDTGAFIGYKKTQEGVILKLLIPESAARTNAIGSRKCRASQAHILEAMETKENVFHSQHNPDYTYTVGTDCLPDKYDPDRRNECSSGIHFYITKIEAESN